MFFQTNMYNRRKFLERSALGAGSVLFSSGLLASCTDHNLPDPHNPIIHPPIGAPEDFDWNGSAKKIVVAAVGETPEVGAILGPLVDIFWPTNQPSPWDQVKAQVEALVNQKIGDFEYELVTEDLQGLNKLITSYLHSLNNGTNEEKLIYWINVSNAFAEAQPRFQASAYKTPLLGLFTQFANMYLSVLRDVVQNGLTWGRTVDDHNQDIQDLTATIQEFTGYVDKTYADAHADMWSKTPSDYKQVQPFKTVNNFDRQMVDLVLDYRDMWPYFDVTTYPSGSTDLLTREIFSDPLGQGNNPDIPFSPFSPNGVLASSSKQFPTQVDVWSNQKYFSAIQMAYPTNGGPNGVTQTPRYGGQETATHRTYSVSASNPLLGADVTYDTFVNTVQFADNNKTIYDVLGVDKGKNSAWVGYDYKAISSAYIQGSVGGDNEEAAAVIVFGFRYWQQPVDVEAIRNLYVKSPTEHSAANLAKAFPKLGITAGLISEELKAVRQAYWAALHARAVRLK